MSQIFNTKEEAYQYVSNLPLTKKQLDSTKRTIKRATKSSQIYITQQLDKIIVKIKIEINKIQDNVIFKINDQTINIDCQGKEIIL